MALRTTVFVVVALLAARARADVSCSGVGKAVASLVAERCDCCTPFRACVRDVAEQAVVSGTGTGGVPAPGPSPSDVRPAVREVGSALQSAGRNVLRS